MNGVLFDVRCNVFPRKMLRCEFAGDVGEIVGEAFGDCFVSRFFGSLNFERRMSWWLLCSYTVNDRETGGWQSAKKCRNACPPLGGWMHFVQKSTSRSPLLVLLLVAVIPLSFPIVPRCFTTSEYPASAKRSPRFAQTCTVSLNWKWLLPHHELISRFGIVARPNIISILRRKMLEYRAQKSAEISGWDILRLFFANHGICSA
jgi:hypothetical protein